MRSLLIAALTATLAAAQQQPPDEFFEMRVRPLFANKCYACHTDEHMGGLQLDTREHALHGGKSGPVIIPGDPENSRMVQALRYTDARLKMPPTGKLKDSEIADIEAWIKAGAVWPETAKPVAASSAPYTITAEQRAFWAFRPITHPDPPPVHNNKFARTEIDRFILAKLEEQNLKPVAPATKRALIRRATFDLTGLPPTPEEVATFERDRSPNAFAKVVDRLLDSPRYGEKWGRFWLDVARYSDDRLDSERDNPYENSFRYRDWVIQAFQQDLPFNTFVKAQIAGDLLPDHERYEAGLGFYALSPEFQDERVDATTRGFLALTAACATCHNHKYDPIPQRDFYSLMGIFNNTDLHQTPLAPKDEVDRFENKKKEIDAQEKEIKDFVNRQAQDLGEILSGNTANYLLAAAKLPCDESHLDKETLERWTKYLAKPDHKHPFLAPWNKEKTAQTARDFQTLLVAVNEEKKHTDDENHIRLGLNPNREDLSSANLASIPRDKYVLWEDMFGEKGVYHYSEKDIDRFLSGVWKSHLDDLRARRDSLKRELPAHYPYLQTIADKQKLEQQHVWLRGNKDSPGEPAPPHFLSILSAGTPAPFTHGSGRLDLAEAIASPDNPLTARVIVNRIWQQHFGQGIVRTPSNFGKQGDTPSHPELLDYLASRFIAEGWSIKKLHREMMLTSVYALSAQNDETDYAADPANRLLWRANLRRLDVESLRDSLLFVTGNLDLKSGGPAVEFGPDNHRRTVYGYISRRRLDPVLALFDFPNPIVTSEQRLPTTVPLQKLFFMNSDFVMNQSKLLAKRLSETTGDDNARITSAYRILFQREPTEDERKLALQFLHDSQGSWPQYAQVLLSSNEFSYLN